MKIENSNSVAIYKGSDKWVYLIFKEERENKYNKECL